MTCICVSQVCNCDSLNTGWLMGVMRINFISSCGHMMRRSTFPFLLTTRLFCHFSLCVCVFFFNLFLQYVSIQRPWLLERRRINGTHHETSYNGINSAHVEETLHLDRTVSVGMGYPACLQDVVMSTIQWDTREHSANLSSLKAAKKIDWFTKLDDMILCRNSWVSWNLL